MFYCSCNLDIFCWKKVVHLTVFKLLKVAACNGGWQHSEDVMKNDLKVINKGLNSLLKLIIWKLGILNFNKKVQSFLDQKCEICGQVVDSVQDLKHHIALHQRNRINPTHTCEVCSHKFTDRSALDEHMLKQHRHLMEMCDVCGEM